VGLWWGVLVFQAHDVDGELGLGLLIALGLEHRGGRINIQGSRWMQERCAV